MSTSRIFAKHNMPEMEVWELPFFGGPGQAIELGRDAAVGLTADKVALIQAQAHQEAYAAGHLEGLAKGRDEGLVEGRALGHADGLERGIQEARVVMLQQFDHLEALMATLTKPLQKLDQQVEEELVALAMTVARHLVRRELKIDPGQVVAAVRQAVAVLPVAARDVRVLLHPADAQLVRAAMSLKEQSDEERRWRILEDATVTRGGCLVETEASRIDASVETRLAAIVAAALGGGRESDESNHA